MADGAVPAMPDPMSALVAIATYRSYIPFLVCHL